MLAMRAIILTYKTSVNGASNLARRMPTTCDADLGGLATGGIFGEVFSSMAACITYGVRLIRMATFWTSWSKAIETRKLLSASLFMNVLEWYEAKFLRMPTATS
jgi:hypothetical protein